MIINNGMFQVNFTKARFDSIRPGRHSVLLILPENLGKSPQPGHLNWDTSTKSPQPRHLNQATSTKIVQNLDSKMVLIIFASNDTRQPSAWRQTHEARTGATCANKRNRREHAQTNARGANRRNMCEQTQQAHEAQASASNQANQAQASASKPNQAQTSANRRKRGRKSTKTLEPYGGKHLRQEFASGLPH